MTPECDRLASMLSVSMPDPDPAPLRPGEGRILPLPRVEPRILADVGDELDRMQERILADLYARMDRAGISRDERLVISLAPSGLLDVGEHPQRESMLAILDEHPELAEHMRRMAALALTERGLTDILLADDVLHGAGRESARIFQASLKGPLSHFHLVRQ